MATSNIKRIVGDAIAAYFAANVTGLSGKVTAVAQGPEKVQAFPSACLLPSQFRFEPSDPDDVYWDATTDDGKVVLDVGQFEGLLEFQLYCKNKPERELYEQRILDLFLASEGAPGTLFIPTPTLTINGYTSLHSVEVKLRLANEEWSEEFSFESRRYSFLDLEVAFPALTTRDAYTIENLQIAITHDLNSNTPIDEVLVLEDGSTDLPPP